MKDQVDELLKEVAADFTQHGFDDQFPARSVSRFQRLQVETEDDRNQYMVGGLRLFDYLLVHAPGAAAEAIRARRQILQTAFDRWYGKPDTPYLLTNRIVSEFVTALRDGGPLFELWQQAYEQWKAVPFDGSPDDELVKLGGLTRINAVGSAYNTLVLGNDVEPESPLAVLVRQLEQAMDKGGVDTGLILRMAEDLRHRPAQTEEAREVTVSLLQVLLGAGLFLRPETAPALEPVRNLIIAVGAGHVPEAMSVAAQCEEILDHLAGVVERDGFSEFAFGEAMNALRNLPTENEADIQTKRSAFRKLIDFATSHAPAEAVPIFRILQASMERYANASPSEVAPLTLDDLRSRSQEIVEQLKKALQVGEPVGAAFLKAAIDLRDLGPRIPESQGDEGLRVLLETNQQLLLALSPYVPKGDELKFQEVTAMMSSLGPKLMDVPSPSEDPTAQVVFDESFQQQAGRLIQYLDAESVSNQDPGKPYVRQFLELVKPFSQRLLRARMRCEAGTEDHAEIERINSVMRQYLSLLGAAYAEEQYFRHQRSTLRRMALDLRQFERRQQLMVVTPAFPTNPASVDANAVFFSGSMEVERLVEKACGLLHMGQVVPHGMESEAHGRWQQLRSAAIAIFDYSAYNPREADPPGPPPNSRQEEAQILGAAGPIAQVAYETGLAYVTGTPMIVLAHKGASIPFDIDVEPVLIHGDADDADRLAIALQASIYGTQHGIAGNCLNQTIEQVRRLAGKSGADIRAMVNSVTRSRDATRVRLTLAAVVDRMEGARPLLVIPAFSGRYPAVGPPRLFHVAAFREWSKTAQVEVENACKRAGVEYRIGYERLNPDVIRAIWTDLCESSFVVADITNLNPNAVLELAIAHALGKRTIVLTQNAEPHSFLPAIAKVRTHHYDPAHRRAALSGLLDTFLAQADSRDRVAKRSARGARGA
jgi:hypothetical protein